MTIIKRNINSEILANKTKEFTLRRINNYADRSMRMRLMSTVATTFCTDNVHLLTDALTLHRLVWIPLRAGPQEDLTLLLNITSDLLAWSNSNNFSRTDLIKMLSLAYDSIGALNEFEEFIDSSNHFKDQSVTGDMITEFLNCNIWFSTVILLSASDIRAELINAIEEITKDLSNAS